MKFKNLYLLLILSLFFGCQSNQKIKRKKQETEKKLTKIDALTMVSEIYDTFQNSEDYLIKGIFYPANFLSQDFNLWGNDGEYFKTYNFSTDYNILNNFWTISYDGIIKANAAIVSLNKMASNKIISQKLANRLKAECYFNRGILYYYLACNFGNVPIVNNTLNTEPINQPKVPQDSVFKYVENNLTKAKNGLPFVYSAKQDFGRATKGAALAYLGESYMWLHQYKKAINAFNQLKGHYKLMLNFLDINSFKHQNNKESIFEIQFNGNDNLG